MKVLWRILGLSAVAALAACEPIDLDPGGGGGGTGGGSFSKGFVFVRNDATGRNVYAVDDLGDPNSPLRLTTQGAAYEPAVAASGQQVAFAYRPAGGGSEIRVVPTTGTGQPSAVFSSTSPSCPGCSRFRNPTFSPNSRTIVFTLDKGGYSQLARVEADGTGFRIFSAPSASANFFGAASFYPDGQSVLAMASNSSATQFDFLAKVGLTDGATQVVSSSLGNTAQVVVSRAVVSPDGTKVAFDGRTSSGAQVFVGELGRGLTNVTQVTRHTGEAGVEDTWPSWRGNTEVTFLSTAGGNDNIYRGSIATSGAGTLVVPGAIEPAYGGK